MNKDFPVSISIGIPVYNEEKNIQNLLYSLASQKGINIEKLIVINDGSTDKTLEKIEDVDINIKKSLNMELINFCENKGKINVLNVIFRRSVSNYLLLLDSDIQFTEKKTIINILSSFKKDENIGLVCGWYVIPINGYFDIIGRTYRFSRNIIKDMAFSKNIYGATGAIMSISKDIYENLILPNDIIRDDAFIYLYVISKGKKFIFNPNANVRLSLHDDNLKGFIFKQIRSRSIPKRYIEIFGELAKKEFQEPQLYSFMSIFFRNIIYSPIDGMCWSVLKIVSWTYRKFTKYNIHNIDSRWRI